MRSSRELAFIVASGAATCASWLAYYHALKDEARIRVHRPHRQAVYSSPLPSRQPCFTSVSGRYLAGLTLMCAGTAYGGVSHCAQHHYNHLM